MLKSWIDRLTGRGEGGDRRTPVPDAAVKVEAHDFDPATGALRWARFMEIFQVEQEQAAGVLLVIDLTDRSQSMGTIVDSEKQLVPWMAQSIRQAIRSDDLLSHVDGYRFAVLLRGASPELGNSISQRILASIDNTIFLTAGGIAEPGVTIGGHIFDHAKGRDIVGETMAILESAQKTGASIIIH